MFTAPELPDNFSISIGYHPDEYAYDVYDAFQRIAMFERNDYASVRKYVNSMTRYGKEIWVVAIDCTCHHVFYTNKKRQKSLQPMHWRQSKGA